MRIEIDTESRVLVFDGVRISFDVLSLMTTSCFSTPAARHRWFQFARRGDDVIVHTRVAE